MKHLEKEDYYPLTEKFKKLKKIRLSTNFVIFLLFFGAASLEAFQTTNWPKAAFWVAIGIVFLVADNLKKNNGERNS